MEIQNNYSYLNGLATNPNCGQVQIAQTQNSNTQNISEQNAQMTGNLPLASAVQPMQQQNNTNTIATTSANADSSSLPAGCGQNLNCVA